MNITFKNLLSLINPNDKEEVIKAYEFAEFLHEGQYRQSGEPYITHPLNVAYILAEMNADKDTICAGLLHDTLEDTIITKEEITEVFNSDIATLVEGVTKMRNMNFSSAQEHYLANTRKIITSISKDVRIIIIKLADRLHNMRTLNYKNEFKQKEKALETMEIFVPLAYYIGVYNIKIELEDLSLRYLKPDIYQKIDEQRKTIETTNIPYLEDMRTNITSILNRRGINNLVQTKIKNVYRIYEELSNGHKLSDIHDLLVLKIMVEKLEQCYLTLGLVHQVYPPVSSRFKDYIFNPKTNMYRSLHTTVFGPNDKLVQSQIRTFEMEKNALSGIAYHWKTNKNDAKNSMKQELEEKYHFFKSINEINALFQDNQQFVNQVKNELFGNKVYVYTTKGEIVELPMGSTVIDFAYKINIDVGNTMVEASVNDEIVPYDYVLKHQDRVKIITNNLAMPDHNGWDEKANTTYAKQKIKELKK